MYDNIINIYKMSGNIINIYFYLVSGEHSAEGGPRGADRHAREAIPRRPAREHLTARPRR